MDISSLPSSPSIATPSDSPQSSDDDRGNGLPHRLKAVSRDANLTINPIPEQGQLIISISPPVQPETPIPHAPCDIVLVIDVSGSMHDAAPVPGTESAPREETGLSVLDLTKHAARTIIHTMNKHDRLGIVTFSSKAKVCNAFICCPRIQSNSKLINLFRLYKNYYR
jgi:hypothetical protein